MTSSHKAGDMHARTISRRRLATLAPIAAIGAAVPRAMSAQTPAAVPSSLTEAPMLAEMVAAGTLPPLSERLPAEPLVVTPKNTVGTYGGTFYGASMAPETTSDFQVGMVTGLFRFANDLSEIYPEVATGYTFSD